MPTTMQISIAKLWTSIQTVEVEIGSNVMVALRKAGFNLDSVVSVKRNGMVVELDTQLENNDVLLVSQEKIKGWAEEVAEPVAPSILKLSFTIEEMDAPVNNGQMAFSSDMSTFEIVKQVMLQHGESMNDFKEIRDSEGNVLTFADKLEDNKAYKIMVCSTQNCE